MTIRAANWLLGIDASARLGAFMIITSRRDHVGGGQEAVLCASRWSNTAARCWPVGEWAWLAAHQA